MMKKKAQAATEYLATYGWAVLILALVLAALWAMGVFKVSPPEQCIFPPLTFECGNYKVVPRSSGSPATFPISITNNFGRKIHLCAYMCSNEAPDPDKGYPTTAGADYESRFSTACAICDEFDTPTVTCGPVFEPGETRVLVDSNGVIDGAIWKIDWACKDANGEIDADSSERVNVGSPYSTRLYIAYSFEGETTGYPRIAVGRLSTTVQRE